MLRLLCYMSLFFPILMLSQSFSPILARGLFSKLLDKALELVPGKIAVNNSAIFTCLSGQFTLILPLS